MANLRHPNCIYCNDTGSETIVDPSRGCGAICDCIEGMCNGNFMSESEMIYTRECTHCDMKFKQTT